jgi:two-component system phosphate regulon sensor histidine kinase PhoR
MTNVESLAVVAGVAVACSALAVAVAARSFLRRRARTLENIATVVRLLGQGSPIHTIPSDVSGAPGRLVLVINEVLAALQTRIQRLEDDRLLLRTVLGSMTDGVVAIDPRRRLLFANDAASAVFGLAPDSVGRMAAELIRNPKVQEAIDATLRGDPSHQVEVTIPSPEAGARGAPLCLAIQGASLPGPPPTGAVLVVRDITETRRLERVRQDFVANASHELKTPLASIKAYAETLLDWALHDETVNVKFLHRIDEQTDRLNMLILDLLSLARLESGQDFFHHGPLLIAPSVERAVQDQQDRARAKGLQLDLGIEKSAAPALVTADEEAVRQVLDNLLDNAIKYTPEGGRVRVLLRRAGADQVLIDVADSGIGIPRADLPRVFERFYRVDKARSRELGGTGLGLSIVKHLVQALGGQITVESRVGVGSTFTVCLPITPRPSPTGTAATTVPETASDPLPTPPERSTPEEGSQSAAPTL